MEAKKTAVKKTEKPTNVHAGHRERVKSRFDKEGLNSFSEHNVLELLLFYAIPQKDTNELAHKLLTHFGSISAVFDAKSVELEKIVGKNAARLIKLVIPVARRYFLDRENYCRTFDSIESVAEYCVNYFIGKEDESVVLLCFDNKMKLLNVSTIAEGTVNECDIDHRKICQVALAYNASVIAISHNHPSGITMPSSADFRATDTLRKILDSLNITLLDHIIVANRDYFSFQQSKIIRTF